jgi:hypothetical protein
MTLRNNGTGIGTGNSIRFINSTNSSSTVGSKIESIITNLSGRNSLKFYVHGGGGSFGALQERMTIDGDGIVSANQFNGLVMSATTYENLPIDIFVTGGTYSDGTTTFTNNTGGTFNVNGFYTGATNNNNNQYVTGFTYNNNTFTISDNSGSTFNATINTVTGLTVNGNLSVTGNTSVKGITGTTALFSGSGQNIVTIIGSGSTLPLFTIQGSSGELFSVTDSLIGSLFSVNDISGLPILEVFSDNTILMGDYLSPSLNTTKKVSAGIGTTTIYSIPVSAYTGAFFDYTVSDGTNLRSGNIMSIFNSSNVRYSETSTTDIGNTSGITFNMIISGGTSAVLQTSGTTAGWTVKTIIRSI